MRRLGNHLFQSCTKDDGIMFYARLRKFHSGVFRMLPLSFAKGFVRTF